MFRHHKHFSTKFRYSNFLCWNCTQVFAETKSFSNKFNIIVSSLLMSSLRAIVICIPLPNVTWHSGTWPYTMTPSIDQTLHLFANLLPNLTLIPILTLLPNFWGFHRTLQRVRLANRGRLILRTPGPVPFGTCICSNLETILSWTCHVYGPFEFWTSLGTSILLVKHTSEIMWYRLKSIFLHLYLTWGVVLCDSSYLHLLIVLSYRYFSSVILSCYIRSLCT